MEWPFVWRLFIFWLQKSNKFQKETTFVVPKRYLGINECKAREKMKVDQKGHTTIIKDTQGDFTSFLEKITQQFKTFGNHNIIIDLLAHKDLTINDIKLLLPLSKQQKKAKKSFAIVVSDIDYNAVPDALIVVPSVLEAHDIIEMDEIERDLGF
jgi:hypothetical protein